MCYTDYMIPAFGGDKKFKTFDEIFQHLLESNYIISYSEETDMPPQLIQNGHTGEYPADIPIEEFTRENSYFVSEPVLDEIRKNLLHQDVQIIGGEGGYYEYRSPPKMMDIFLHYHLNYRQNVFTKKEIEKILQYSNIIRLSSNPRERCGDGISFMCWHDVQYNVSEKLRQFIYDNGGGYLPRQTTTPHIAFKLSELSVYTKDSHGIPQTATPEFLEFLGMDNNSFFNKYRRLNEFYLLRDIVRSHITSI